MSWSVKKLSTVAQINPRRPTIERNSDVLTSFVPMEAVNEVLGEVTQRIAKPFAQVKKGYTYFENGDVIFAKITPCMQNGKHAVLSELTGGFGFGSTEFHVIRAGEEIVPEWIHYYLRRKETLDEAIRTFTGTVGQQRVPTGFLVNLEVPIPPIEKQRQIAARLKAQLAEVDMARQGAEVQLRDASLLVTRYRENAIKQMEDVPRIPLGELLVGIEAGKSFQTTELIARPDELGVLKVSAVSWNRFLPQEAKAIEGVYQPDEKHRVKKGDLIISRANTLEFVGAVVRVADDYPMRLLSDKTLRLVVNEEKVLPDFLLTS